jgi:O-antigen/teichoic acid export membrane protein
MKSEEKSKFESEESHPEPESSLDIPSGSIGARIGRLLRFDKFDFLKDVARLLTGNVLVQSLSLGLSPVLTRLYLPEFFGVSAVFSSLYSLFSGFTCFRYEVSIVLTKTREEAANMLSVSVLFAFLTTAILIPVVWFLRNWLSLILKTPLLGELVWLIPIISFLIGLFNALNYWNTRQRKFSRLSFALVLQELAMDAVRLGAGFFGMASGLSLVISNLVGSFSSFAELARRSVKEDRDILKIISWKGIREGIVRYKKFPLFNTWAGLINNFAQQLPTFMLAAFFSSTVTGHFSLGYRMTRLPVVMVSGAIGQVFLQRAAQARHDGTIKDLVQNTFSRLVMIGIFPLLLITLIGRDLFSVVLGSQWAEAGIYSQIISIWTLFVFISSPLLTLANVYERQEINLGVNTMAFVSRGASLLIGGLYHNVILALSLVALSGSLIEIWFVRWALTTAGVSIFWGVKRFFKGLLFSLPFLAVVWLFDTYLNPNSIMLVGFSAVIGIVYYIAVILQDSELRKLLVKAKN